MAKTNHRETWRALFNTIHPQSPDTPIPDKALKNPHSPLTCLLLYILSLDTFLTLSLTQASLTKDKDQIDTLGPYSKALFNIISHAQQNRREIHGKSFELYKGMLMEKDAVMLYDYACRLKGTERIIV